MFGVGERLIYQALVHTSQPHGVDLADIRGLRLQELFERDSVLGHFARGDSDAVGFERFADRRVAEDVVGVGRLCRTSSIHFPPPLDT